MRTLELTELINACKKFDTYNYEKYVTVDWHGTPLVIKNMVNPKDVVSMFENILNSIKKDNGIIIELFDFSFRFNIVSKYSLIEMPDDVETQYKILYGTDLFKTIIKYINREQFKSIVDSFNVYFGTNINY